MGDLFEVHGNPQLDKDNFTFSENSDFPYFTRTTYNNGILGYVDYLNDTHKINGNCIAVGMMAMLFFYMEHDFYAGQFTKRIIPKNFVLTPKRALYFISLLNKNQRIFQNVLVRNFESTFNNITIQLPTKNNTPDFEFLETFIAELEADRIAELEAYLTATGLKEYELTKEEENAIAYLDELQWREYNLKQLFGLSTRGKRLKSADRLVGTLPFVTAGEAKEGISAYISNRVEIFSKNTTTIDMFGSAKYRNYEYGADDHVAVVHTEQLPKLASMFMTTTIHKASYTDRFNYSRNFYAKDADELNVLLPTKNDEPDYVTMELIISAIQKLIIKDVVLYTNKKIDATKETLNG